MDSSPATIAVVDDDALVMRAAARLLHSNGFAVAPYSSREEFPFDEQDVLDAVRTAMEQDPVARNKDVECANVAARSATLTLRERQVLDGVVGGKRNKQIAAELGVAEKTIKVHRSRVMQKMAVRSLAELVSAWTKADCLGLDGTKVLHLVVLVMRSRRGARDSCILGPRAVPAANDSAA